MGGHLKCGLIERPDLCHLTFSETFQVIEMECGVCCSLCGCGVIDMIEGEVVRNLGKRF